MKDYGKHKKKLGGEQIMIEIIIAVGIPLFLFGMLIGLAIGQHSVWKGLRRDREVVIDNWKYTADLIEKE